MQTSADLSTNFITMPAGFYILSIDDPASFDDEGQDAANHILQGDLDILTNNLVIRAALGEEGLVIIDGAGIGNRRVFHIQRDVGGVELQGLIIQGGRAASEFGEDSGGGILVEDNQTGAVGLTIRHSLIAHNHATGFGGGIANFGRLEIHHSTIANNSSEFDGGGLYDENGNNLEILIATVRTVFQRGSRMRVSIL